MSPFDSRDSQAMKEFLLACRQSMSLCERVNRRERAKSKTQQPNSTHKDSRNAASAEMNY